MEKWKRRDRKLRKRRGMSMRVKGRSIFTILHAQHKRLRKDKEDEKKTT